MRVRGGRANLPQPQNVSYAQHKIDLLDRPNLPLLAVPFRRRSPIVPQGFRATNDRGAVETLQ